jgi:uncharacterized protein with NRDE domain
MCTLAIYFRHSAALPLVVAANRDEFYARPTAEPQVIAHDPWVVAGQDLSAGGTWLGTNQYGMIVGLLNRRNPAGPDPRRRSRGLLCLEALQSRGPDHVLAHLLECETATTYNWFNLLLADSQRACVISNAANRITVTELPPGVHVLTNLEINDPTCPRIARSHQLFAAVPLCDSVTDVPPLLAHLRAILADHTVPLDPRSEEITNRLCIHSPVYGTRSSSVLLQFAHDGAVRYWHAPGPPCRTDFTEVLLPDCASAGHGASE